MFYDMTKDPAAMEAAAQLHTHDATPAEIMERFMDAEPERQLCIISLLEVANGEPIKALKEDAVRRLLAKVGIITEK